MGSDGRSHILCPYIGDIGSALQMFRNKNSKNGLASANQIAMH